MFGVLVRSAQRAAGWVRDHKAATAALVIPVIGVGVSAAVIARDRFAKRRSLARISVSELETLTHGELEDMARRLERAHRESEIR